MRAAIAIIATVALATSALAADGPTMEQCKAGWKADYSKMWTENDFKMACAKMMEMKKPMGTSDPSSK